MPTTCRLPISRQTGDGEPGLARQTAHRRGRSGGHADAGGDPTRQGRWKPGSATVKREYLDRAQSRSQNPWHQVQAARGRTARPDDL
ncbi:hypothetical protein [Streptomyces sp. NPDC090022]|uniref:hypothetical protein n=1 Tax=Streptomyces sp. NPDC090022 TaxID=3365920 RepID=UPI00382265EA